MRCPFLVFLEEWPKFGLGLSEGSGAMEYPWSSWRLLGVRITEGVLPSGMGWNACLRPGMMGSASPLKSPPPPCTTFGCLPLQVHFSMGSVLLALGLLFLVLSLGAFWTKAAPAPV